MSRRVDRLAGKIATRMLAASGAQKSAGSMSAVMPVAVAYASAVVAVEKALKSSIRAHREWAREVGRLVDANGEKIARLAESYESATGHPVRGAVEIHKGFADFRPDEFRVGLVPNGPAPKMNGHSSHGDGVASASPPMWHPDYREYDE